ncbi:MAG: type II CRISPR RNA-guided endonuclease Cas9 [Bacteroidales bacterium]|nr:type II CRISPR RNA-guided endonuclease Cas9 [Bacteroidales bacterium]
MKKILGLDLGTNSIGWAVVETNKENEPSKILGMGSRIIPMGSDKNDYEKGATITKNADRRQKRSIRRMSKRYQLRRNKLLYALSELGMLPNIFQFKNGCFPEANKLQELELLPIKKKTLQLDSLQHYELRCKALNEQVELKELGTILYKFNSLRGYAGGGNDEVNTKKKKTEDEEDESTEKKKFETWIQKFKIISISDSGETFTIKGGKNKGQTLPVYTLVVTDEDENEYTGKTNLQGLTDKINTEVELEIKIKRTKKNETITFGLPKKTDWKKQMEETEKLLKEKKYYPCQLAREELLSNKWHKVRNRVILRQQYEREFDAVWDQQAKHYEFLNNCPEEKLKAILNYIFPGASDSQKELRNIGLQKGLKYIIKEQIIYYQRPLKSQSDLIGKCQFEKDEQVVAVTHPIFQEFRCWDQINRMYITSKVREWNERKNKEIFHYQNRFLSEEQKMAIYQRLKSQKELGFNEVAKIIQLKNDGSEYLNGLNVKAKLKGCDSIISIRKQLRSYSDIVSDSNIEAIWFAIYNNVHEGSEYDVNSKRVQSIVETLPSEINKEERENLSLSLAQNIKLPRKYANLSKKAIENILPIMQLNPTNVPDRVKTNFENIKSLIETGEIVDESLLQDYIIDFVQKNPNAIYNGGLMYAFAASLVYGRHTKESVKPQITNYHDIQYKNRNLRNPIVEQIANETMQVVKAVWKQYALNPNELEIRVELARDLKNSASERESIYKAQIKNRKANDSIKERLKQDGVPVNDLNILKYRLYSQQRYISPYTGKTIEFSALFDEKQYNIDHIIPKSRYYDDSIANKVICESDINEEKDNRTAWEYISQQNSRLGILSIEKYLEHINSNFFGIKKKNLLAEKIPSNPVARQLKDTQYISVAIKDELATIVGSDNVKTSTGGVTDYLRSQWGLRKLFMELTESRFKQMELWDTDENGNSKEHWIHKYFDKEQNKNIYEIKGWSKRFDHRHHAIDALVVALSNEKFIKRLNDLNKYFQDELRARKDSIPMGDEDSIEEAFFKLAKEERDKIMEEIKSSRKFDAPIDNLVSETKKLLETMVVSQKPKDKLSIKTDGDKKQLKIRAALHQETYYGKTNGRDTKTICISDLSVKDIEQIIDKTLKEEINNHRRKYDSMKEAFSGEGLVAFNESRFQTKNNSKLKPPVYKVKLWYSKKDTGKSDLQRLYGNNDRKSVITGDNYLFVVMEKNGKRIFDIASLFDSVAIAKDCIKNNYCNIDDVKKHICDDIRIQHKEQPEKVLFYLQQNDLVYMPDKDEKLISMGKTELLDWLKNEENKKTFTKRLYKVVKFTGKDCFFIPNNYAKEISLPKELSESEITFLKEKYKDTKIPKQELNYAEFSSFGNCIKVEPNEEFVKSITTKDKKIKQSKIQDFCVKVKTDWLGNIIEFNGMKL